jgi:hypothetical protein
MLNQQDNTRKMRKCFILFLTFLNLGLMPYCYGRLYQWESTYNNITYNTNRNSDYAWVSNVSKTLTDIILPEQVFILYTYQPQDQGRMYPVKEIKDRVCEMHTKLRTVTIQSPLTRIGRLAFYYCTKLDSVRLPDKGSYAGNTLETIDDNAFLDCWNLRYINLPVKLKTIGRSAFKNCTILSQIDIPYTVEQIEENAFMNCSSLSSIIISTNVGIIGNAVFKNCKALESVGFYTRHNLRIKPETFDSCLSLKSVTMTNDRIIRIDSCAFRACMSLPKITITASVVEGIGASAFEGCTSLDSVTCLIEEPYAFGKDAFKNISPKCVLTVPYGKRAAYIAAGWTTDVFKGGVVELPAPEGIQTVKVNRADKSTYYDLEGREVLQPEKGRIYIHKGRKVLVK